jgi:hypothetical protein
MVGNDFFPTRTREPRSWGDAPQPLGTPLFICIEIRFPQPPDFSTAEAAQFRLTVA